MYQDRVDTLLFTTPEKNLNLDILNNNQAEKLYIVNASSMVEDLLNNYENFIWGPMNGKTPAKEEFKNMNKKKAIKLVAYILLPILGIIIAKYSWSYLIKVNNAEVMFSRKI